MTMIEVMNERFVVPDITGHQHYVYKVTTDGEFKGIAYHIFALNVKPVQQNKGVV